MKKLFTLLYLYLLFLYELYKTSGLVFTISIRLIVNLLFTGFILYLIYKTYSFYYLDSQAYATLLSPGLFSIKIKKVTKSFEWMKV